MLVLVLKHKKNSGLLLVLMLDQFIKCLCLCLSIFRCARPISGAHQLRASCLSDIYLYQHPLVQLNDYLASLEIYFIQKDVV